jgi:hypothetical protein
LRHSGLLVTRLVQRVRDRVKGAIATRAFCAQDAADRALLELFLLARQP